MQIAAHAARKGQTRLADDIRKLVDDAKSRRDESAIGRLVPIARPTGDLAGLVTASYPDTRLSDMVLDSETALRLDRVLMEYRQSNTIRSYGLNPRRKLLFVGPPGCGKTMSASALAGELKLPLMNVQLHGLITKFMGETAVKLSVIFESMAKTRGVYFFDEFDALGAQRNSQGDVGEIRRVLNSFLQFLEQDQSDSLIIAATNLIQLLDPALFRRFDDVLHYGTPAPEMIQKLVANRLVLFNLSDLDWEGVVSVATNLSHAEIVRACEDAAKDAVLRDSEIVTNSELIKALERRKLLIRTEHG